MKSPLHSAALGLALTPRSSLNSPASAQTPAATPKSGSQGSTTTTKKPATSATHSTYDRALLHPALLKDKAPDTYVVKFVTTRGDFTVTVIRASAPIGADRFYNLVKHHFYDNAVVFRAVPNFVTQFGISSYPAVSTAWKKTEIKTIPSPAPIKKARSSSPRRPQHSHHASLHQSQRQRLSRQDRLRSIRHRRRRRHESRRNVLRPIRRQRRHRPGTNRKNRQALSRQKLPQTRRDQMRHHHLPSPDRDPGRQAKTDHNTPKSTSAAPKPKPAATPTPNQ